MIDEKKIEEAKRAFIADKKILGVISIIDLSCGFKEGAHWAIEQFLKDLWHDAKEDPINGDILVESTYTSDGFSQKCYSVEDIADIDITYYDWKEYVEQDCITRWLYIEDLLPKKGGSDGKT